MVFFRVKQTVVEAAGAALPELDFIGLQDITAPMGRHGNFLAFILLFYLTASGVESFTSGNDGGLLADPGADLAGAGALAKIGFALGLVQASDQTGGPDLAFEFFPVEAKGGVGIGGEVLAFATFVVGEEGEAGLGEVLQKNHAKGGAASRVGGG